MQYVELRAHETSSTSFHYILMTDDVTNSLDFLSPFGYVGRSLLVLTYSLADIKICKNK